MAIAHFTLSSVSARSLHGTILPVYDSVPLGVDTLTSFATAQTVGITAPTNADGLVWRVASDVAAYVTFDGTTPAADAGYLVLAGVPLDCAARPGQQPKIIAA